MRTLIILSAAALTAGVMLANTAPSAEAAGRWCLNQANVGSDQCKFMSRRQCMAARTGNTDACTRAASRRGMMTNGSGMMRY